MNSIKISTISKMEFSEYYEIKKYVVHPSERVFVRRYNTNIQKIKKMSEEK